MKLLEAIEIYIRKILSNQSKKLVNSKRNTNEILMLLNSLGKKSRIKIKN